MDHDHDERSTETTLMPTGAEEEDRKERALVARLQRGYAYREAFETDFDREVFMHGSQTRQDYTVPEGSRVGRSPSKSESVTHLRYGGQDTPSYG
jgi:hypothetical protein